MLLKRIALFLAALLVGWVGISAMIISAMSQKAPNCIPHAVCLSEFAGELVFFGSPIVCIILIWVIAGQLSKRSDR